MMKHWVKKNGKGTIMLKKLNKNVLPVVLKLLYFDILTVNFTPKPISKLAFFLNFQHFLV
jgi:hypothetical protein